MYFHVNRYIYIYIYTHVVSILVCLLFCIYSAYIPFPLHHRTHHHITAHKAPPPSYYHTLPEQRTSFSTAQRLFLLLSITKAWSCVHRAPSPPPSSYLVSPTSITDYYHTHLGLSFKHPLPSGLSIPKPPPYTLCIRASESIYDNTWPESLSLPHLQWPISTSSKLIPSGYTSWLKLPRSSTSFSTR